MVVRPAKHEDRAQLIELMKGYFAFYRTPFPASSKVEALLGALDGDPDRGVQLVAEADGRLQGFATLYASFDTLVADRSEEHTSELQSQFHLVCRLLLEKKNK